MREISPPSHRPPPGAGFLWFLLGSESEERDDVHRQGRGCPGIDPVCLCLGRLLASGVFPGAGEDVRRCQSGPASAGQWDVLGSPARGPAGQEVGRGVQAVTAEDSQDKKSGY